MHVSLLFKQHSMRATLDKEMGSFESRHSCLIKSFFTLLMNE